MAVNFNKLFLAKFLTAYLLRASKLKWRIYLLRVKCRWRFCTLYEGFIYFSFVLDYVLLKLPLENTVINRNANGLGLAKLEPDPA